MHVDYFLVNPLVTVRSRPNIYTFCKNSNYSFNGKVLWFCNFNSVCLRSIPRGVNIGTEPGPLGHGSHTHIKLWNCKHKKQTSCSGWDIRRRRIRKMIQQWRPFTFVFIITMAATIAAWMFIGQH